MTPHSLCYYLQIIHVSLARTVHSPTTPVTQCGCANAAGNRRQGGPAAASLLPGCRCAVHPQGPSSSPSGAAASRTPSVRSQADTTAAPRGSAPLLLSHRRARRGPGAWGQLRAWRPMTGFSGSSVNSYFCTHSFRRGRKKKPKNKTGQQGSSNAVQK